MTEKEKLIVDFAIAHVGCPYIYGATNKECTVSYRNARISQYPQYKSAISRNCQRLKSGKTTCSGCKWFDGDAGNGKLATDCAQLTRYAAKAADLYLPSGASSQWNKGDWIEKGPIADLPKDKVCFLYRRGSSGNPMNHTGIYLGNGECIHSKGHDYGTVRQTVESYDWTDWARLDGMDGANGAGDVPAPEAPSVTYPTIRKGSKGEMVVLAQTMLIAIGFDCGVKGADGIFGEKTKAAVVEYQKAESLAADGIVGRNTWTNLVEDYASLDGEKDEPEEEPKTFRVTISGLDFDSASQLLEDYGERAMLSEE